MRLRLAIALGMLGALVLVAMLSGLDGVVARWVVALQQQYQNALGGALRALRAGQPGAVSGFLTLCFAYGLLHAAGPGHGKAVLAGYALSTGASLRWLAGLAALTSLMQAAVAVIAVYAAVWAFGGSRERVEGVAGLIEPFALLALAVLGLVVLWRGTRHLLPVEPAHHEHGPDCGCAHVPDVAALRAARSWHEAALLVGAVALRPCTGALVLLALTWRLELDALGILGAFVMGFGTLVVTVSAALIGGTARRGLLAGKAPSRVLPLIEIGLGGAIAVLAALTAMRLF